MKYTLLIILITFSLSSCNSQTAAPTGKKEQNKNSIPIIRIDKEALSGVGLKPVKNQDQPDRRLFQKRLIGGNDLSVYVVSSETATAHQENYSMEEFIFLINGRSRMKPTNGDEVIFDKGQSFVAPKGFTGEWETLGGDEFLIELSIISTRRVNASDIAPANTLPILLDSAKRSGITISQTSNGSYYDQIYKGIELTIDIIGEVPTIKVVTEPMTEQVVEVLSGTVEITPTVGKTEKFYTGDYYMIPQGFTGTFETKAHGLFRTMNIRKT